VLHPPARIGGQRRQIRQRRLAGLKIKDNLLRYDASRFSRVNGGGGVVGRFL
jgi:hypothetical protein